MKIAFIIGTRPEIIKVAPVIQALKKYDIDYEVINTAQHRELMDSYWELFDIKASDVLDLMVPNQNLSSLTSRAILGIQNYLDKCSIKPDIILAQGDTTTVMAASVVCFYNDIRFAHLEAGLRSFNFKHPFPEEFNRRVASMVADVHLCPTELSEKNLLNEKIDASKVHVVGNTVIDALYHIRSLVNLDSFAWKNEVLSVLDSHRKFVLITCHRRENHGANLLEIIDSIIEIAAIHNDISFIWTLHPNPNVRNVVLESKLASFGNVLLVNPLDYVDILKLLNNAVCVISDSGGIQEEAPSFGVPVIVLRETTERPEGVNLGLAFLAGSNREKILFYFSSIINKQINPNFTINPYGDGHASKKIVEILLRFCESK